jgi:predicted nucleic acid-binding protein
MIIVDTNVLSELVRPRPNERVTAWFGAHPAGERWTTATTEAEMLIGLAIMPPGRRKAELQIAIATLLEGFEHRILPFDRDAAKQLPGVYLERRMAGCEPKLADSQIAAIARAHRAAVATRDSEDYAHSGITNVNPRTARP